MNWTRNHDAGEDPKHYREWRAGRGRYRIVWRDRFAGVTVAPSYHCTVKVVVSWLVHPMWDRVERYRKTPFYRTFKAAKDACETHADPDYRPARKKKRKKSSRKAPMKECSQCKIKIHARKMMCDCGYQFPKKVKK